MWSGRGLTLPSGTKLRMVDTVPGRWHTAEIVSGHFVIGDGGRYDAPSSAAKARTEKATNGWVTWLAKRPDDDVWTPLSWLREGRTARDD